MLRTLTIAEVSLVSGGLEDYDEFNDGDGDGGGGGDDGGFGDGGDYGGGMDAPTSGSTPTYTDPATGDIVVTGTRPAMDDMGSGTYAQFYSDGIAVLWHGDGGILGTGINQHFDKMGNFTYTVNSEGSSNSHTNTANLPASINDGQTWTSAKTNISFTHTNLP